MNKFIKALETYIVSTLY